MGYRSSIYIKVKKEDKKNLLKVIKDAGLSDSFNEETRGELEEDFARFYAHDLKWYSNYPDVKKINAFISEEHKNRKRGLIAVGEDGMTEEFGEPWEVGMYTSTDIDW